VHSASERYPDGNAAFTKRRTKAVAIGDNGETTLRVFPQRDRQKTPCIDGEDSQKNGDEPRLNILLSSAAAERFQNDIAEVLGGQPYRLLTSEDAAHVDADIAVVTRDVTGSSTKHELTDGTRRFYDSLRAASKLRWVHTHSAGVDRPIFNELLQRGVRITTSSGANARPVAQMALAGLLTLARRLPQLMQAQREHVWRPLLGDALPRDITGQTAVIVGYGAIGQRIATLLGALDMHVIVVRREVNDSAETSTDAHASPRFVCFASFDGVLCEADWLVLACPLTSLTRGLIDARRLAMLPRGAHIINVARGEVVVEHDLIAALRERHLAGAFLDVFEHEPLPCASRLWDLPNVIVTPHTAGHVDSHYEAVGRIWLDNLARWQRGDPLVNEARA
jgi:phosphoglycerate dehydrogenase-like enzyme